MAASSEQVILKLGFTEGPTCFHGIRQAARENCECCCKAAELLGLAQDTGDERVLLHDGEFRLYALDLEIPGRGFNWKLERTYRSGIAFNGPLGHNWEFNHNRRLVIETNGNAIRMDGYGRADRYALVAGGFESPAGFYTRLVRNEDRTFTEQDRNRTQVTYSAPDGQGIARMTELHDRNGNRMRFEYNSQGQLSQIFDTLGRHLNYHYSDGGRLVAVEDFLGRTVRFEYDTDGNLLAAITPLVSATLTGNDFPNGKSTRYRYISNRTSERLDHLLIEITAPNETASGGPPHVRVTYDTNPASANVGRVMQLTLGGVNENNVPAGGNITYEYLSLNSSSDEVSQPIFQNTVTNRNGNRSEYQFNQLGNILRIRKLTNRKIRLGDPEFFETRFQYNKDGELLTLVKSEGNSVQYVYDDRNPDRLQQGNLLAQIRSPDQKRSGEQKFIKTTYTFEPIYNQKRSVTEARGNDPEFIPQNGGASSAERYTTVSIFDYQEGNDAAQLAKNVGLSESEVRDLLDRADIGLGLGDVNDDRHANQFAGNVVKIIYPTVILLPDSNMAVIEGGTSQPIEETFTYNQFGQMTRRRDAEGNVTLYDYHPENDPDGDGKNLNPEVGDGPFGYLKEFVRDAESGPTRNARTNPTPAKIKNRYFYDAAGNVIRKVDGRGIATDYTVNELNQVVQISRAADVSAALRNPDEPRWTDCGNSNLVECAKGMRAYQYRTRLFYDYNNNMVRQEVENRDSLDPDLLNEFVVQERSYDILNNVIEEKRQISVRPVEEAVKKYRYDRNENSVLEISPVANLPEDHAEFQPSNVISFVYYERDLVFTRTRGGIPSQFRDLAANSDIFETTRLPNGQELTTVSRHYDGNRYLVALTDASANLDISKPGTSQYRYDGFDRLVSVIDPLGNQSVNCHDAADNVVRVYKYGPERQPLLAEAQMKYDELGRKFEQNDHLFVYSDITYHRKPVLRDGPLFQADDGWVTTRFEFDRKGRPTTLIKDDLSVFTTFYDGADRVLRHIDSEGNQELMRYDGCDNLVTVTQIEVTQNLDIHSNTAPDLKELFTSINVFDSLNRLIRTTDNLGHTFRRQYDSLDNLIILTDAQHSNDPADLIADPLRLFLGGKINRQGNISEYFYDGLKRKIADIRYLHLDGQGKAQIQANGTIATRYGWDHSDRLAVVTCQAEGLTQITQYRYDDKDRRKREILADGTICDYTYDPDDRLIQLIDGNGSIIRNYRDPMGRLIRREITRATSKDPHPAGGFKDPGVTWQVTGTTAQEFAYDGLSRITLFVDSVDPNDPAGSVRVTYSYDSLGRLLEEVQNGHAVSSRWNGVNDRVGLVYPNGRELAFHFDALGHVKAITDLAERREIARYTYIGPNRVLERTYRNGVRLSYLDGQRRNQVGYDGVRRPVKVFHLRDNSSLVADFSYDYDRANNKLREFEATGEEREDYSYDSLYRLVRCERPVRKDLWALDGLSNWVSRNGLFNIANVVNEYDAFAGVTQVHDDNGNLIEDGLYRYQYDFANRICRVIGKTDDDVIAVYRYDAFNRRITSSSRNAHGFIETVEYRYDDWREIEEKRNNSMQQYVYGPGVDEQLTMDRYSGSGVRLAGTLFYHHDDRANVRLLTDEDGNIIERYSYDPYGSPVAPPKPRIRISSQQGAWMLKRACIISGIAILTLFRVASNNAIR